MIKYLFIFSLFIAWGCSKKKDLDVPGSESVMGDFYPLVKGNYRLYEIRKSTFSSAIRLDSVYQLKEVFADTFHDLEGGTSYKILRFRTRSLLDTFALDSVWYVKASSQEVVKTENNVPLLKLSYPLGLNKSWNGNKYNADAPEYYKITGTAEVYKSYTDVLEVTQSNDSSLLHRDLRKETYARDLGLVYKLTRTLNFSSSAADFGKGVITNGVIREEELIGYGQK